MTISLLDKCEPPAVVSERESGVSPFVFLCDHAGRRIPARLNDLGVPQDDLKRHIAWDIGIEGVGRALSSHFDACLIMQPYSRLVIDCNRWPGSETSMLLVSEGTNIPGNQKLSAEDAEARVREIFDPYHSKISRHLDERRGAGRATIIVSLHSFTPVYTGIPRPWHAGVLYNRDSDLSLAMFKLLEAESGLVVGDNEPYSVTDETDYSIPVHGEQRGLSHLTLEIRQDLLTDKAGQIAWAERLARLLPLAVEKTGCRLQVLSR
jgi:predicted N-formylglutamate amidohydrolase